jgi:hypothetical protein
LLVTALFLFEQLFAASGGLDNPAGGATTVVIQTFMPFISLARVSLFASISGTNILTGRNVTLSAMNLSKLNIFIELKVES